MWRRVVVAGWIAAVVLTASLIVAQEQKRQQGRGGPFGFRGFGGPGANAQLLGIAEVQKELGISDEQKGLVEDMLADLTEQGRAAFGGFRDSQNLSEEERRKRMEEGRKKAEELGKKAEEMIGMILEPKQVERLGQLGLQRQGTMAFARPDIIEKLGLTEEQQQKVRSIGEAMRSEGQGSRPNFRDMSEEERREMFAKMRERMEKANADVLAVLTPGQKENWDKMQGKKFEFPQRGFGGRPGGGDRPRRKAETSKESQ